MIGVELVRDRESKEPAIAERNTIVQECFQKGLLLLGCGVSSIRFSPPLVIDQADADTALDILDEVISAMPRVRRGP